jgi:hypothetical protein
MLIGRQIVANRHTPGGEDRRGRQQRQMNDDSFHLFPRSFGVRLFVIGPQSSA